MDGSGGLFSTRTALRELDRVLDRINPDRSYLAAAERLECVRLAQRVAGRVTALAGLLVAEADATQASMAAAGTPLASWLGMAGKLSRREAAGLLHQAKDLAGRATVGQAAAQGRIGTGQAKAINRVLTELAPRLDAGQQVHAEQVMLELAGHLDADQLGQASGQVLGQVAPASADELLETRLQRQAEEAQRQRSLRFFREGGSIRFDGSLPRIEGEAWIAQLNAIMESQRRTAIEARDPLAATMTPEQRRADALISLIRTGAKARLGTGGNGPTPPVARVFVLLDYDKLLAGAADAGVTCAGEQLSAGELRRLCCEAELIPAVLGGDSEILDLGQARRLASPEIRTALILRDRGCIFPGCDAPPELCDAHHIQPWQDGGTTSLANLMLLCHRHHGLCEPAKFSIRDQWQARIATDGLPEFIPPARIDPEQRPIRHHRHQRNPQTQGQERAGPPAA